MAAMKNASVKAPGKILWIGGYSVLERSNIAYISTVDAYVTATLKAGKGNDVLLNAPQMGMSLKGTIDLNSGCVSANAQKELMIFKTAAEVAARYASVSGEAVRGFNITTNSDAPFAYSISKGGIIKSGLGSSAATAVAIVGSVLRAFGMDFDKNDALHKLSQIAHSIATGKVGSGFDIAAATYGSILYKRYSPEIVKGLPSDYTNDQLLEIVKRKWDYTVEKFALPEEFRLLFANFGESMITTKAIGSVSDFKRSDPRIYSDMINEIDEQNEAAVKALKEIKNGNKDALERFKTAFDRGRSLTKKLGVFSGAAIEPDDCTELIEESKKNGAFVAKLPGAGGKDSIAALSLDEKSYSSLLNFWKGREELNLLDIKTVENGAI